MLFNSAAASGEPVFEQGDLRKGGQAYRLWSNRKREVEESGARQLL